MAVVTGIRPQERSRQSVAAEFRRLLASGTPLVPAGKARRDPKRLLDRKYVPRHLVTLFGTIYYLTDFRFDEGLDFFVGYVAAQTHNGSGALYPRIFYKDVSLLWRVASHVVPDEGDWIGKGDVQLVRDRDGEHWVSDEDTTNLPYEIQSALDEVSRRRRKTRDAEAVGLVLRNAPYGRIRPYADFSEPRRRAAARGALNGGRPVARITRRNDPTSLRFARGFEPEFDRGVVEVGRAGSRLYGGEIRKYRVISRNAMVQYLFIVSPTHVWINPPQALTTEITSYGLRALYVPADEAIFVPGFEYHYMDDSVDPPELYSQIPEGFAGAPSPIDPERVDASAWIEKLPVIREFRRRVLRRDRGR